MPVTTQDSRFTRPIATGGRTSVPGGGGVAGAPGATFGNQGNPFAKPSVTHQGMSPADLARYQAGLSGQGLPVRTSASPITEALNAAANASAGVNFGGSTTGGVPSVSGPIGTVQAPGVPSGTNAALLRAKDRAGLLARGALSGLRGALGERGILGSGVEGRATRGIAETALGEISDVNREQAIKEADQAARFAELGYQGAITQRGQDITMRGQDIQAQQAAAGRAQSTYQSTLNAMLDALRAQVY